MGSPGRPITCLPYLPAHHPSTTLPVELGGGGGGGAGVVGYGVWSGVGAAPALPEVPLWAALDLAMDM